MPFIGGIAGAAAGVAASVGAGAAAAAATAIPAGAAGRLRIEPDQLDAAIQIFRDALDSVESEVATARRALMARPPANDDVSVNAAAAFNRVGLQNPDSAVAAWEGCVQQLRSVIEQLIAAKEANVAADTSNSGFLRNQ